MSNDSGWSESREPVWHSPETAGRGTVLDAVGCGLLHLDRDGRIVAVNDEVTEMAGRPASDLEGSEVGVLLGERDAARVAAALQSLHSGRADEVRTLDVDLQSADGDARPVELRLAPLVDDGTVSAVVGVVTDVGERVERERELERYRTLVESMNDGVYTVDADGRFSMVNDAYVELLGYAREDLLGSSVARVVDEETMERARELETELRTGRRDVARLEADLRTASGDTVTAEATFAIVPLDDERYERVGVVRDVSERVERERELERQSQRLAALNDLSAVVRDVSGTLIEQSTREEIERVVCERLTASDSYQFAWIGEADRQRDEVVLRTAAGVEDYLEDVVIPLDPEAPGGEGPTALAVRTRELQVTHDVREDPEYEPWRDHAEEHGFRSSAAVPIAHDGVLYGVLNVYAARPGAFEGEERDIIGHLGQLVGHVINAVERKRGLTSDEVIELEFGVRNLFDVLDIDASVSGEIGFDRTIPVGDGSYLVYGRVSEDGVDALSALQDQITDWEDVTLLTDEGDPRRFEVRLSDAPLASKIATLGGRVPRATIEDGQLGLVVHLPLGSDVRAVVDAVHEAYPWAELLAQRQTTRSAGSMNHVQRAFDEELTDRQRNVVEAAYFAGFFEWPRDSSGEEIATSLDISASTFHQHVRAAERRLFEALFTDAVEE